MLGFCPQSCSWHGLSLHPVPVLCFHLLSHSTIMTSASHPYQSHPVRPVTVNMGCQLVAGVAEENPFSGCSSM